MSGGQAELLNWLRTRGVLCQDRPDIGGFLQYERPIKLFRFVTIRWSEMGAYSYASVGTNINRMKMGRYCSVGAQCSIGPSIHSTTGLTTSPFVYKDVFDLGDTYASSDERDEFEPVTIGHDVWIGSRASIMGGVKVGSGAVIGFGSVVTKDVPPYAVVAGAPATVRRMRLDERLAEDLLSFGWWRYDMPAARRSGSLRSWHDPRAALDEARSAEERGALKPIDSALNLIYQRGEQLSFQVPDHPQQI